MAKVTWNVSVRALDDFRTLKLSYEESADNAAKERDVPLLVNDILVDHLDDSRLEGFFVDASSEVREQSGEDQGPYEVPNPGENGATDVFNHAAFLLQCCHREPPAPVNIVSPAADIVRTWDSQ